MKNGVGLRSILTMNPVRENSSFEGVVIFVALRLLREHTHMTSGVYGCGGPQKADEVMKVGLIL